MTKTNSYIQVQTFEDDCEHDDVMTAEDYDAREYYRNGWNDEKYDRQRY
jgi:hypothetical protein